MCSECFRVAHLLEFRRHVLVRFHDAIFWQQLHEATERMPGVAAALGLVTLWTSRVMGSFAPPEFTSWTMDCLPESASLWVDLYARRLTFVNHPGSKLYLLLQKEMEIAGIPAKRSLRQALIPQRFPPAIFQAAPEEGLMARLGRYRRQTCFVLSRLRFHTVEGFRYLVEAALWRLRMNRLKKQAALRAASPVLGQGSLRARYGAQVRPPRG